MPSRRTAVLSFVLLLVPAASILAVPDSWPFFRGLGAALLLAGSGLFAARAWVRARPADRDRAPAFAIGLAGAAGFLLLFQNVLVHDALWYYGYLRSSLLQGDLDMYDEFVLRNAHGMYLPPPATPLFHLGTSILEAPAAFLVRPLALALARAGVLPGGDGYGPLEIAAATFSSLLLALGGVALTQRLARRFVPGPASAVAQAALLYGSPLAYFAFIWPGYPHAATVFLGGLFLLLWAGEDALPAGRRLPMPAAAEATGPRFFLLGLLGGALALVHPQDVLYLALPLSDLAAARYRRAREGDPGPPGTVAAIRSGALLLLGAVLAFAPQLAAWRITSGSFLPHVYAEIGDPFRWSRPALFDVLFSSYNGLVTWTPLCGLAAGGILLLRRERPRLFRGFLLLLVLEWWAVASYGYWWGGASFGARYFLSVYPVLGVGLALLTGRMARRLGLLRAALVIVPLVYWNLLLMAQFRLEWMPHNRPPDFLLALSRQFLAAPAELGRGLCGASGWNQVAFLENLRAAAEEGSAWRWLGVLLIGVLLALAVVAWVARLAGPGSAGRGFDRPRSPRRAPATLAAAALAALAAVLMAAPGHDARRVYAEAGGMPRRLPAGSYESLPLEPGGDAGFVDPPTAVVLKASVGGARTAAPLSVDLVSFLHHGEAAAQGERIGWLTLSGRGCDRASFPLRAGIETAETAPGRFEVRGSSRHTLESTREIQSWWQRDRSARHYWGHAYLASFDLPPACRPERAVFRTVAGPADLEVRRLVVVTGEAGP